MVEPQGLNQVPYRRVLGMAQADAVADMSADVQDIVNDLCEASEIIGDSSGVVAYVEALTSPTPAQRSLADLRQEAANAFEVARMSPERQMIVKQLREEAERTGDRTNLDAYLAGTASVERKRDASDRDLHKCPTSTTPWFPRPDGRTSEKPFKRPGSGDDS